MSKRYAVLRGWDGVFEGAPLASADTHEGAKSAIVRMVEYHGFEFDELAIADSETGRLMSHVIRPTDPVVDFVLHTR